jgi:hypothetical protein
LVPQTRQNKSATDHCKLATAKQAGIARIAEPCTGGEGSNFFVRLKWAELSILSSIAATNAISQRAFEVRREASFCKDETLPAMILIAISQVS